MLGRPLSSSWNYTSVVQTATDWTRFWMLASRHITRTLNEDAQVAFKGKAKMFVRTYSFLAAVLPYTFRDWELLATFLNFLIPKLPAPKEEDLSKGILETIDMDSYRVEVEAQMAISLPDADASLEPVPLGGGGGKPEPELERLSNILKAFNDQFGSIPWKDAERVRKVISEEIPRQGCRRPGVPKREEKLGQTERPY